MVTKETLRIFIGYDSRERDAFRVCRESLLDNATAPLCITALDVRALEHATLYRRPWCYEDGQFVDQRDGKPFSTEFSFSRFLVPALSLYQGWSLFCDSDFLWLGDVAEVFDLRRDSLAAMVVKHDFDPPEGTKMRGQAQTRYFRKLWSSLILWNCGHAANRMLTPYQVNHQPGQWLHGFTWIDDAWIGELPEAFNWIPGHSPAELKPRAIHYTRGTPDMPGHAGEPAAESWWKYLEAAA